MRPSPPPKVRKHFLTRYTVRNGISNLYILLKSALKIPNFKQFPGGHAPGPPYNCVVTMASPSLKSWLRHCFVQCSLFDTNSRSKTYKCMWLFLCLRATKNYKVSKITVIFIHNIHILISNAYFPIFQRGLQPQ